MLHDRNAELAGLVGEVALIPVPGKWMPPTGMVSNIASLRLSGAGETVCIQREISSAQIMVD
jgi:hypothetical protein